MILEVDNMDKFRETILNLLAFEQLLSTNTYEISGFRLNLLILQEPRWRTSTKWNGRYETANRINQIYGYLHHEPVILIDCPLDLCEKIAYHVIAERYKVNVVSNDKNLVPYEYIVCRSGSAIVHEILAYINH